MSKNPLHCGVHGCGQDLFQEGVCFWHFPLWEIWGYEHGGYQYYGMHSRKASRAAFTRWLNSLRHQGIVDILAAYDFKLMRDCIRGMDELRAK
jgi:hypothetical protein